MLLVFGWIYHLRKFVLLSGLSLVSIAIAATGGLSFVFGIGDSDLDSMLMAGSFITAVYLTFLAILNARPVKVKRRSGACTESFDCNARLILHRLCLWHVSQLVCGIRMFFRSHPLLHSRC